MSSSRLFAVAILLGWVTSPALGLDLNCPATISSSTAAVDPWSRIEEGPAPQGSRGFSGFTLYEGPVADLVALVPDRDDGKAASWKLEPKTQYSIVCLYAGTKWNFRSQPFGNVAGCTAKYLAVGSRRSLAPAIVCN